MLGPDLAAPGAMNTIVLWSSLKATHADDTEQPVFGIYGILHFKTGEKMEGWGGVGVWLFMNICLCTCPIKICVYIMLVMKERKYLTIPSKENK